MNRFEQAIYDCMAPTARPLEETTSPTLGYDVAREDALYHVSSRQAFIWPYDSRARLAGEHLYEDKTSLQIEEVSADEAITPAGEGNLRRAVRQARGRPRRPLLGPLARRPMTPPPPPASITPRPSV